MTIRSNFRLHLLFMNVKIYKNNIHNLNWYMVVFFFSRYRLSNEKPILNLENSEYFTLFPFPSYIFILNNYMSWKDLKESLFLYAILSVNKNRPKFETCRK